MTHPFIALACTLSGAIGAQDAGWPQFGGPDHTGVVQASAWSATGAEAPLWTRNVGLGYSCPSIVLRRLVTMGYDPASQEDRVLCLDADTGEELWRHAYSSSDDPKYHGGGTLTTPTIADGVVYTTNRHGRAFALDLADGRVLWERDYRAELELEPTFHGYCASPYVVGDRIVHVFGGVVAAAGRADGAILWRTTDEGDVAYSNPFVFPLGERTLVAAMQGEIFYTRDLADGAVVHEHPWPLPGTAVHVAAPLVIGDRVLLSSAYGKGAALLRLGEARAPEVLWTSRRLRNKVTGLCLHEGHVYGFDESMLKCFDLEGNERWHVRGLGMGALSIAGGRLLVLTSSGELIVAEATPEEFRELSRRPVLEGGAYWTMPVLVDGLIYVRNSLGDLACIDHRGDSAGPRPTAVAAGPAPEPAALFAAHASAIGAEALRGIPALVLRGEWEIPGRGMAATPASLRLEAPNRWRMGLDSGAFVRIFDGERGWEVKNGVFQLFDEIEAVEAPYQLALAALFAPVCPADARAAATPVRFAGSTTWCVTSSVLAAEAEAPPRTLRHHFDVTTGRLVGREGDELGTLAFEGEVAVGPAKLPARIRFYRASSGQEECFHVTGGEQVEPDATAFARPAGVLRLLRTPEERAADSARLRQRYARELGTYRPKDGPEADEDVRITVEDGELYFLVAEDRIMLAVDPENDAALVLQDFGRPQLSFEYDEAGLVTGARLSGEGFTLTFERL